MPHINLKPSIIHTPQKAALTVNKMAPFSKDILYLIRKNPASIGGVQRLTSKIISGVSDFFETDQITWTGAEWGAPFYFPIFYWKAIRNQASLVHCDDTVTALLGARVKSATGKIVITWAHGLDVILPIAWYQRRVAATLPQLDRIICPSRATARQVESRGVDPRKIEIIPAAAEIPSKVIAKNESLYAEIERELGIDLRHKRALISLGRPVARKGFDYFAERVFPHLPDDYVYIVAGPKPKTPFWINDLRPIIGKRLHHNLMLASGAVSVHDRLITLSKHPRIFYINGVSESLRERLLAVSDLFIMPNRTVDGDMEGFGLVALEASIRGIPVIATGIEGIVDAVIDGKNGFCVSEGDWGAMAGIIMALLNDPMHLDDIGRRAAEFSARVFSQEVILGKYRALYESLLTGGARFGRMTNPSEKERFLRK